MLTSNPAALISALTAIAGVWLVARILQERSKRKTLPPGPPGWPLIGNVNDIPKKDRWLTFAEWARRYGDLTYVNLFGTDMVIVNSLSVLSTLHETKYATFSDRASMYVGCDLVGWGELSAFLNLGPEHTAQRKLMAQTIGTKSLLVGMQSMVDKQTCRFIKRIIAEPNKLYMHTRTLIAGVILAITYGYEVAGPEDKFVVMAEKVTADLDLTLSPGAYMADLIPAMKYIPSWLPGGGFKKKAAVLRAEREQFADEPYEFVLNSLANDTAKPSVVARQLEDKDNEVRLIKLGATMMYVGGAHTAVAAVYNFFLCLLLFPEAQKRAQAEIDSVLGPGPERLPTAADRSSLPYVEACWKESMRWHTLSPSGLAHKVRSDEVHDGYHIPKGTLILSNIWWYAHNPDAYPDPSAFRPERFLGDKPQLDPTEYVFGIGRRGCPGQLLAENMIFTIAVHLLALCDLLHAKGPDGKDIPVEVEWLGDTTAYAKEFPVDIRPRSSNVEMLLNDALATS